MSYDPTLGRWVEADPERYVDGPNMYQMEHGNPVIRLDPMGLDSATQPAQTQPATGSVTVKNFGNQISFLYQGPGKPTFYQTVEVRPAICSPVPSEAVTHEKDEHNGHDPTKGPVGDYGSGDPTKPYGTGKDGRGNAGHTDKGADRGLTGAGGNQMTDRPSFPNPPYPDCFYGEKVFVTTVEVNGQTVKTTNWRLVRDDQGTRIEVEGE